MTELDNEINNDVDTDNELPELEDDVDASISYEELIELKKKALSYEKSTQRIVELKRELKELKGKVAPEGDAHYVTKEDLKLERFLAKNPEMESYQDDLRSYMKKDISLEEAKLLIEAKDKTIEHRKKTNSMNVSRVDKSGEQIVFTRDELSKMSQSEYNLAKDKIDSGKATVR